MELRFLESLQLLHSPILNFIMIFITKLGNGGFIWIIATIYLLFQNKNKLKREGFTIALALIIFSVFGLLILKPIIARPRPFTIDDVSILIKEPMGFSFPSGHTGSSFAAASVMYFYNKKRGILAQILWWPHKVGPNTRENLYFLWYFLCCIFFSIFYWT